MRKFITLFILLLLAAAALTAVNYTKMTHIALTNGTVDSTAIGVTTPAVGNFTKAYANEGSGTTAGYSFIQDAAQDTGMFSASDGVVSLYANAVEYLHISAITPSSNQFIGNASTASALAADPGLCGTTQVSRGISTFGVSTCVPAVQTASNTGCTTAATSFASCSTIVSWPVAYSDTTYKVVCSGINANDPRASINSIVKSTGSVTVATVTNGSNSASYAEIDCEAKP